VDHAKVAKLRGWAQVLAQVAAVLLALAALVTALKGNGTTKAAYEEHDRAIVQNQHAVATTHEQLEALQRYVDEHPQTIISTDAGEGRVVVMSVGSDAGPPKVAPLPPPAQSRPFNAL
jgi:acyl-CoA synthetase (NDP forming)